MSDYTPVNSDGFSITLTAGAAINGGFLVKSNGTDDTVIHTAATTDRALGVAAHDAASGSRVSVILLPGYSHELPVTQSVTVTAGNCVVADANGKVNVAATATAAAAGTIVGFATRGGVGNAGGTVKVRVLGA